LRDWLKRNPGARLVVIDTLAMIRGEADNRKGVYQDDYQTINAFKNLADEFTVPIVLVHHIRKGETSDPVDAVSGTAGLTGSADTILVLRREPSERTATLYVRGRDVEEQEVAMEFEKETGRWIRLRPEDDHRNSDQRRRVIKLLVDNVDPMTPSDIAKALNKHPGTTRFLLFKMRADGQIWKIGRGKYSASDSMK